MTIQLELTPEQEAQLTADAQSHGVEPQARAAQIFAQTYPLTQQRRQRMTPDESRAFLEKLASLGPAEALYPGETFDRAFIYGDHD